MGEGRLLSVVHSNRTRSNGLELGHGKLHTNMQNSVTLMVTELWNRLSREVVDSISLEIFKTCLDTHLCSLL